MELMEQMETAVFNMTSFYHFAEWGEKVTELQVCARTKLAGFFLQIDEGLLSDPQSERVHM